MEILLWTSLRALGAVAVKQGAREVKDYLKYNGGFNWYKGLVQGIGTYMYTQYTIITTSLTETAKNKIKKENDGLERNE